MLSLPLDITQRRMTSSVACHHRLCKSHIVGRRRTCHDIMSLGHYTWVDDIACGIPLSPFHYTHGRAMSSVACLSSAWTTYTVGGCQACLHHCPWTAHMVERRRAWPLIISLGQHTRSDEVGYDLSSSPLEYTHERAMSRMVCHKSPWTA